MTRHALVAPVLAGTLLALAAVRAGAWPQIPSQNVGIGAQSAFLDHGNATCPDGLGGSFVAWTDVRGPMHVYVQHLDATGAVVAGWPADGLDVSPTDTSPYADCTVMGIFPSGAGSAIVTWIDWDIPWVSHSPFWAQRVADPRAGGPTLWTAGGVQLSNPLCRWYYSDLTGKAAPADDGGILVAFSTHGDAVRVQHVTPAGTLPWGPDGAAAGYGGNWPCGPGWDPSLDDVDVVRDGAGGAYVVWDLELTHTDPSNYNYWFSWEALMQHVDASGNVVAGAWPTNGNGLVVSNDGNYFDTRLSVSQAHMAPDGTGGVIVVWPRGWGDLEAQHLLANGSPTWGDPVNNPWYPLSLGWQVWDYGIGAKTVSDGAGGALLAFACADSTVDAMHLLGNGTVDWNGGAVLLSTFRVGCHDDHPDIVADGLGGADVAWEYGRLDGTHDIATQHLDNLGNLLQGPAGALLTNDAYDQLSPKACLDGGAGAIVSWIDQRPVPAPAMALSPAELRAHNPNAANSGTPARRARATTSAGAAIDAARGAAPSRVTAPLAATAVAAAGGMFAQQVNSIGQLGGRVIGSYTTGVAPPGVPALLAVHGGAPNPVVDRMRVAFSLPRGGAASLEVMDVAGRRVWAREVGALGAGRHVVDLGSAHGAAPGLYFVRLRQGTHTATGKVMVAR